MQKGMVNSMKVIMLGAPGAGKGTQAKMIAEKYGVPHISTGDIFRANIKEGTELGMEAKKYMDQGQLVPDELTVRILLDRVAKDDCKNGYVLDGFPRTIPQAEVLDKALSEINDKIDYAINVDVPDENIINRMGGRRACLSCGATYHMVHIPPKKEGICDVCGQPLVLRDDDKPETVKNRLDVYHKQTQPLIDFYNAKGILKSVDGTVDMKDVFAAIVAIMVIVGVRVLNVPVVPMCLLVIIEAVIAVMLHHAELWVHGLLILAELCAGVAGKKTVLIILCAVVYIAATFALQMLDKGETQNGQ